jgi:hypothetical protein
MSPISNDLNPENRYREWGDTAMSIYMVSPIFLWVVVEAECMDFMASIV